MMTDRIIQITGGAHFRAPAHSLDRIIAEQAAYWGPTTYAILNDIDEDDIERTPHEKV